MKTKFGKDRWKYAAGAGLGVLTVGGTILASNHYNDYIAERELEQQNKQKELQNKQKELQNKKKELQNKQKELKKIRHVQLLDKTSKTRQRLDTKSLKGGENQEDKDDRVRGNLARILILSKLAAKRAQNFGTKKEKNEKDNKKGNIKLINETVKIIEKDEKKEYKIKKIFYNLLKKTYTGLNKIAGATVYKIGDIADYTLKQIISMVINVFGPIFVITVLIVNRKIVYKKIRGEEYSQELEDHLSAKAWEFVINTYVWIMQNGIKIT